MKEKGVSALAGAENVKTTYPIFGRIDSKSFLVGKGGA